MFPFHVDFNPLPRKEGDVGEAMKIALAIDFNPLPRKEGDGGAVVYHQIGVFISIHSLVKRETANFAKI